MSTSDSSKIRRDGWTAERQRRFLDTLWRTGSVSAAAASAGMSRESAYRLRRRKGEFAADWNRALESHRTIKLAFKGQRFGRPICAANPPNVTVRKSSIPSSTA
jgi:hypothetical protein